MRSPAYLVAFAMVLSSAVWAYSVNSDTKDGLREIERLQTRIAAEREALDVLRVEWAFLNRPQRLDRLVAMHFDELGLIPLDPQHFGGMQMVAYPTEVPSALPDVLARADRSQFQLPMTVQEVVAFNGYEP